MKTNIRHILFFTFSFLINLLVCYKESNMKENTLNLNENLNGNINKYTNILNASVKKVNMNNELKQIKELSRGIASLSIIPSDDNGMINTKLTETKLFYSFGLENKQFKIKTNTNEKLILNSQTSNLITRSFLLNTLSVFNSFIYIYKYKVLTEVKNNNQNSTDSNFLAAQPQMSNSKQKSYEFVDQQIQQTQWRMVISDNFDKNNTDYGWNYLYTTTCGKSLNMLGGFNQVSSMKLEKTISYLPRHQFVMIEMNVYLLGKWNGESLYVQIDTNEAKYDPQYYFTTRCTYPKKRQTLNGCLEKEYCRLREKVRINLKHFGNYLKIIVGTTLETSPDIKSYGISDFRLYIK